MTNSPLKCDICGAVLDIKEDGSAVCEYCRIKNILGNLREKAENFAKSEETEFIIVEGVLIAYTGNDTVVTIPENVKAIWRGCFKNMKQLEKVILPEGLLEICGGYENWEELGAFSGCESLREIDIPDSVQVIGPHAFSRCKALCEVKLPKGLKRIEQSTFECCAALRRVRIPDGVERIAKGAFNRCAALEKINIPDSIVELKDDEYDSYPRFLGCGSLVEIEISDATLERLMPKIGAADLWKWYVFEPEYAAEKEAEKSPWYLNFKQRKLSEQSAIWMNMNRCRHCGGELGGIFTKSCKRCGKKKDY